MERGAELFAVAVIGLCAWAFVINPMAHVIGETLPALTLAHR